MPLYRDLYRPAGPRGVVGSPGFEILNDDL